MRTLNLVMGTISTILLITIISLIVFNIVKNGVVHSSCYEF